MEFLLGFIGALVLLLLVGGGFVLGWKLKERMYKSAYQEKAKPLAEAERQRLKEQQAAFTELQNYSVETAYRMGNPELNKEQE